MIYPIPVFKRYFGRWRGYKMEKQDYLKVIAISIILLLIFDVIVILTINGYKPTITSKNLRSETKEGQLSDIKINNERDNSLNPNKKLLERNKNAKFL